MQVTTEQLENQMRMYAENFLTTEYGTPTAKKISTFKFAALNTYETGGISEATDYSLSIAAKRDFTSGRLTNTTKLILRHELGHIVDEEPYSFQDFEEQIEREKKAWQRAKPKNAAEQWYKNISVRTHLDPLKMATAGFPTPETKVSVKKIKQATKKEIQRMKKHSLWVDTNLAKRFAMINLIENSNHYQ